MSDWEAPVPIFENEDEAALISEFVKLSAHYPNHTSYQITEHLFKNKCEPSRFLQAAQKWSPDLAILERIRIAKLNGGEEPKNVETKEQKLRKLEAWYDDEQVPFKERLNAMRLHSELQGEIVKAIDKKVETNGPRRHLRIVQAAYPD